MRRHAYKHIYCNRWKIDSDSSNKQPPIQHHISTNKNDHDVRCLSIPMYEFGVGRHITNRESTLICLRGNLIFSKKITHESTFRVYLKKHKKKLQQTIKKRSFNYFQNITFYIAMVINYRRLEIQYRRGKSMIIP